MRLLLLSDIHANNTALQAVLKDAGCRHYDRVVHLGDAVGYGPHPHEVISCLRELRASCVLGNHDQMLIELVRGIREYKESVVGVAIHCHSRLVSEEDVAWMETWQDGIDDPATGARYRHGTPTSLDKYANSVNVAREAFANWSGKICFVGHTHQPIIYATLNAPVGEWIKAQSLTDNSSYMIPPAARLIINPGSVGQPRDGNPKASYGILDTEKNTFEVFRVDYDILRTQEAMKSLNLPQVLITRLSIGK